MQNFNSKFKSNLKGRCYQFSLDIIELIDNLSNQRSNSVIGNQILRSATSIGANLVEGSAASSRLEFKKFHEIALKSANETKYWLGLLQDSGKIRKDNAEHLLGEVTEISNMIAAGILKLKGKI